MRIPLPLLLLPFTLLVSTPPAGAADEWAAAARQAEAAEQSSLAERRWRRAIDLAGTVDRLGASWNNLAAVLDGQERFLEAEAGYRTAIRLLEDAHGAMAVDLAKPLNNLANVHRRLGRLVDAERGYLRSLAIRKEAWGGDDPAYDLVRVNLARLYQDLRRYEEAAELYRAVDENLRASGEIGVTAAARHNRAALLLELGRTAEGIRLAREALELWSELEDEANEVKARAMLAGGLLRAGRLREATAGFKRALDDARKVFGARHPETGRILLAYSATLRKMGEKSLAKRLRAEGKAVLAQAPNRAAMEHVVDVGAALVRRRSR